MSRDAQQILKDALALSPKERAELADSLLESLDTETDSDVEEAWYQEIRRRVAEIDAGLVETVPWAEVRARLLAELSNES